jgi:hypothetical protein
MGGTIMLSIVGILLGVLLVELLCDYDQAKLLR